MFRLIKLMNSNKRVVFDRSKPEGTQRKIADITKLRKIVGSDWPTISFDDGLREMIDWQMLMNKGRGNGLAT